ncbi:MAG: HlyD family type I secretion periplasmic adaptor subunit [Micavibrio aeruginosavorus]|uniref:HlyD family type I secretion periplasmic adaptor subunit n=1 Tax=Micavibrio aeruginosavorus TaxID=349221 RepID=A0A2W5N8Q7_9BACT|nr:MAG: HlyD family type I secretion periplasmic adaptor subunit [Micavibrio aeruginosavorus]
MKQDDDRIDLQFMEELEAAVRLKPSRTSNLMLTSVGALVVILLGWMAFSDIDEMTHGEGQVVPSSEIQIVQSLEGGVLKELMVSEGDLVQKDQPLAKISDVAFASEERGTAAKQESLQIKKIRLEAEVNGKPFAIPAELAAKAPDIAHNEEQLYQSRQRELTNGKAILTDRINRAQAQLSEVAAKISRLSESKKLTQQELAITQKMVEQKAVPQLDAIRLNRELNEISGQINEAAEERTGLQSELGAAQKEREDTDNKFRSQALGELNETQTELSQLNENLTAIGDRVDRSELRSPVEGIVNKIMLKTIGGVVEPAMKLMEIVPTDDKLKIIARVPPSEIAFLHPGQKVKVKISAYDPQRYGSLDGELVRIGANSVRDGEDNIFFEIEVRTNENHLGTAEKPLPITPGMVAQVEIITGERSILEYLMKPVLRAKDRALTER